MNVLEYMEKYGHEQFSVYTDPDVGLRAFIAIHDTTLGPALGGVRVWPYATEDEAIMDALRLGRAMTYKSAAAGLPFGGGKAVIMADPRGDKTEALMRSFGRFVNTLGGRYLTTGDVGTSSMDLEWIAQETTYVTGLPLSQGGSGDTSRMTGYGIFQGMKACAKEIWGNDSLEGRKIALQGLGHVAEAVIHHLLEEKASLVATDINEDTLRKSRTLGGNIEIVAPQEIYDVECDILSPCALGGVLNSDTIPRLKCKVICGGANNQLLGEDDGDALKSQGILYAPDYIVNAGGVINISFEVGNTYNEVAAREKTARIYDTMQQIIATANNQKITTVQAANRLAENRIEQARRIRRIYL